MELRQLRTAGYATAVAGEWAWILLRETVEGTEHVWRQRHRSGQHAYRVYTELAQRGEDLVTRSGGDARQPGHQGPETTRPTRGDAADAEAVTSSVQH